MVPSASCILQGLDEMIQVVPVDGSDIREAKLFKENARRDQPLDRFFGVTRCLVNPIPNGPRKMLQSL
jgi:hypothetical protein